MTLLFWDIDGTLLTTGRAGLIAWQEATREVTGVAMDLTHFRTAGLTDFAIAAAIIEHAGGDPAGDLLVPLVRRYESLLPSALPRRAGRVLDGVREALDALCDRPDVRSLLLTGNTRGGARAKLTHYGLWDYFVGGAFSEDASSRAAIARQALAYASRLGAVDHERAYVIGDTPHDITCGQAIGARTIAVASGDFTVDELFAHGPWRAVPRIPEPGEFLTLLEIEPASAS